MTFLEQVKHSLLYIAGKQALLLVLFSSVFRITMVKYGYIGIMKYLFVCNKSVVTPFLLDESLFVKMKIITFQNCTS